jgi:hypothetical protein
MNEHVNGKAPEGPTSEQVAAVDAQLAKISPVIKAAVHTTIRGLIVGGGGIPPHVIMSAICFETANFLGNAVQGELSIMAQIRKALRDAFEEGMRKAPIIPPVGEMQAPPKMRG